MCHSIMAGYGPSRLGGASAPSLSFSLDSHLCPLCLSHHDELLTLICGHKFCKRCLSPRTDGNILICPSCNRRIDLGDHGLEGLQDDYLINNILELVTSPDDVKSGSSRESIFQSQWLTNIPISAPTCHSCHEEQLATKVSN